MQNLTLSSSLAFKVLLALKSSCFKLKMFALLKYVQDCFVLLEQCNLLIKSAFHCNVYAVLFYAILFSLLIGYICLVGDRKKFYY